LYASGGSSDVVYTYAWHPENSECVTRTDSIALAPAEEKEQHYPAGMALSSDGRHLYVAENLSDSLCVVDLATRRVVQRLATGPYPYAVVATARHQVFVSSWGADDVATFDVDSLGVLRARHPIDAGRHPSALIANATGSRLFAASASTDRVAVIDTRSGRTLRWLEDAPPGNADEGCTPNALALSPDGRRLFVAEADANAAAVFNLSAESSGDSLATGNDMLAGRIPAEWYPTAVIAQSDSLVVVNGKGRGTAPNPAWGQPGQKNRDRHFYTLGQLNGSVSLLPAVDGAALGALSQRVTVANGWDRTATAPAHRYPPFEHVIYIIKENRTYDQILGDLPQADGDTALTFFPRRVSPNHHALAERFGIFDRFFVNSEVSYQGHPWSTSAYVTDFTEKTTDDVYRRARAEHDDPQDADDPAAGYLWDAAIRKGITLRNYGEFSEAVTDDNAGRARTRATVASLEPYTSPDYPPFDMAITDQHRVDVWSAEFAAYAAAGNLPALEIMHLPDDHTSGARKGLPTPQAAMADNDLALGRIVDTVSHSRFWKNTVIFVLEDDAQDGPDHVDSHRSVMLVISAWNRGGVFHRFVNTTDVLATMEEILGLAPLSHFDNFGRALREIWREHPDLTPYTALPATHPLDELNVASGPDARASARMDLTREDRIDDEEFNRILWRTIKGTHRPYPGPMRAPALEYARSR
ncbi:MAG TPA: bifunctional YncE family protein/alkaline phosphatase family protein, partial [Candidatus Krumholzibacteria bacterium]|nr:bifunctional YncE family protein/alkaline phosphatase family protein [Candidatus Krumholzibacteria bacterium]